MLWVGQFGIVAGEALERTPWVGAYPDPVRAAESADLFLIVEPATESSAEFCEELKDVIGSVFHSEKLSLTGGMLRALRAAHEQLREWNRRSLKDHWVAAGVSCLSVREGDFYLAQVAPANAALYRNGQLAHLEPSLPDAREPLGLYDDFLPEFTRLELAEGDRILLLSPALARAVPEEALSAALALPPEDCLPALYRDARALAACGALLAAPVRQAESPEPAP